MVYLFFDIAIVPEQLDQGASPADEIVRHSGEHREEAVVPGNEANHFFGSADSKNACVYSQLRRSEQVTISRGNELRQIAQRAVVTVRNSRYESHPGLWETSSMASYSPKIKDRILLGGHTGRFVIVGLDVPRMTADVRSTSGDGFLLKGVPWKAISELEEGQDSARAVREAREK